MIITIDGPSVSGKGTLAKALAQEFSFYYLYTGLLYRAVAWAVLEKKGTISEHLALAEVESIVSKLTYAYVDNSPHILYAEQDITARCYEAHIELPASHMSALPVVRQALLPLQRNLAKEQNVIVDGRDCGTVLFPDADIKFYITADLHVRAERYLADKKRSCDAISLQKAQQIVEKRDLQDQNRTLAPLKVPENATIIDTTHQTPEQTITLCSDVIRRFITSLLNEKL